LPLSGLLPLGLPQTHDGRDHVARIANFYQSLAEGNMVPRWAGNLNWGYGHPILMFLYPFPSYLSSFFHFFGFDLVDSIKLFFGLTYLLSGIFMYAWLRREFLPSGALAGALIYTLAPYRFVDLYVRGAIGEHAAFAFFPLLMLAVANLTDGKKRSPASDFFLLAFSVGLLILSHNALSLMFFPVAFLYALYRLSKTGLRKGVVFWLLIGAAFGFGMSAFFWLPAFFEGKYTLRDIVTRGEFATRYVSLADFFRLDWNYGQADTLPKQLGLIQWLVVFAAVILVFREKTANRIVFGWVLVMLLLTLLFQTELAAFFWEQLTILQKFQFPWRFLSLSVFLVAVLGGMVFDRVQESFKGKKFSGVIAVFCLGLALIVTTNRMWKPKGYLIFPETYFSGPFPSTTDTGESSPIWSVRFMEKYPPAFVEVIDGKAEIVQVSRTSTARVYRVNSGGARLLENTLYFPAWKVYVDGRPVGIEFQDPGYRGLITFPVPAGNHEVLIQFEKTKVRTYAELVSLLSFGLAVTVFIYLWKRKSV
jgi:hypothetical protein